MKLPRTTQTAILCLSAPDDVAEKDLQSPVMSEAIALDWLGYHTHDSRRSSPGFPDCVFVRGDRIVFAELKGEQGKLTTAQHEWLTRLRAAGAEVYLWKPSDWLEIRRVLS